MRRLLTYIVLLASLMTLGQGRCSAGLVYVQAGVAGFGFTDLFDLPASKGSYSDYWAQGTTGASAAGSFATSEATASVSLLGPNPGLRLLSQSSTGPFGQLEAHAAAEWRDIVHLSGGGSPPPTLRAVFQVSGSFQVDRAGDLGGQAGADIYLRSLSSAGLFDLLTLSPGSPITNLVQSGVTVYTQPKLYQITFSGAEDLKYDPGTGIASWRAIFDLPYSDRYGGYLFNFVATADTSSIYGPGSRADFGSTFRLTDVTLDDGSSVSGAVTFDSGFSLQAVPEPSSVIMLITGSLASTGYAWHRRRRAAGWHWRLDRQ